MEKTKKSYWFILLISVVIFFGVSESRSWGYSITMTIDSRDDAGISPILPFPFVKFVYSSGEHYVPSSESPFNSKQDVVNYADSKGITNWTLYSSGNIWSSDQIVGDYLIGLAPGPYRVSVVGGAFMRDSFNWSSYYGLYWWELHIQAREPSGNPIGSDYILGSTSPYSSANEALSSNLGKYYDINLPPGGSLLFWIYDINSIDNLGDLTFKVTLVPIPPTFLLFGTGLLFFVKRDRLKK